ncbi:hypothetical protein OG787_45385 [Streptomyces sp. NBC_00075]|uniref:hypothetical protein n=1 Tax=Streptomyces sp. NBC_00075 TaxID=2975641 RepID=UPI0032553E09
MWSSSERLDQSIDDILVVGRAPLHLRHPKVHEIIHADFTDFRASQREFEGADACFFRPRHLLVRQW